MKNKSKAGILMLAAWFISRFSLVTFSAVKMILECAIGSDDSFYLIMATALVVVSNAIKAILLYCGWFLLAEGVAAGCNRQHLAWVIPLTMIPISYQATPFLHLPSVTQFGFSAFFALLSVLFLQYVCREVSNSGYKILIQIMIVFAIQWLDVIPSLTTWGLGAGELSTAVKSIAVLMSKDGMVGAICMIFFFFSAAVALLMARLFVSYEKQLKQLNLIRDNERALVQLRHQQASARLYQELQLLIHDLKRPLTVIVGLANLLSLSKDKQVFPHGKIILEAAEGMDMMINEIRAPQAIRGVSAGELIDYTMSQVRPLPWGESVITDVDDEAMAAALRINMIRFSRALVNLMDNASHAAVQRNESVPYVRISAWIAGNDLLINIDDNGAGFTGLKNGASPRGTAGLGLVFVKQVIEDGNCRIHYEERPEGGTRCVVLIPTAGREDA